MPNPTETELDITLHQPEDVDVTIDQEQAENVDFRQEYDRMCQEYWNRQTAQTTNERFFNEDVLGSLASVEQAMKTTTTESSALPMINDLRSQIHRMEDSRHLLVTDTKDQQDNLNQLLEGGDSPQNRIKAIGEITRLNGELEARKRDFDTFMRQVERSLLQIDEAVAKEKPQMVNSESSLRSDEAVKKSQQTLAEIAQKLRTEYIK